MRTGRWWVPPSRSARMDMDHADALERMEIAAAEPDGLEGLMAGDTADPRAVGGGRPPPPRRRCRPPRRLPVVPAAARRHPPDGRPRAPSHRRRARPPA